MKNRTVIFHAKHCFLRTKRETKTTPPLSRDLWSQSRFCARIGMRGAPPAPVGQQRPLHNSISNYLSVKQEKKTRTERERESERERKGTEHVGRSEQMMSAWNCTRRISNNILYQEVPVERLVAAPVLVDQESFDRKGFGWSAFFYRHLTDYTRLIIPFCTLWAA